MDKGKRLKVRRPARLNGDERFSDENFRNFGREKTPVNHAITERQPVYRRGGSEMQGFCAGASGPPERVAQTAYAGIRSKA